MTGHGTFEPDVCESAEEGEVTSWVYVIGAETGDRKIGVSDNPFQRLGYLRPTSPDGCRVIHATKVGSKKDAYAVEKVAHKILRLNRTRGEWFDVTTTAAIAAVVNAANVLNTPAQHVKGEDLVELFTTPTEAVRGNQDQQFRREPRYNSRLTYTDAVPRIERDIYERIRVAAVADRRTIFAEVALALEEWLAARNAGTKRK